VVFPGLELPFLILKTAFQDNETSSHDFKTVIPILKTSFLNFKTLFPKMKTSFPDLKTSSHNFKTSFPGFKTAFRGCFLTLCQIVMLFLLVPVPFPW
jgi:hypothetical protein